MAVKYGSRTYPLWDGIVVVVRTYKFIGPSYTPGCDNLPYKVCKGELAYAKHAKETDASALGEAVFYAMNPDVTQGVML